MHQVIEGGGNLPLSYPHDTQGIAQVGPRLSLGRDHDAVYDLEMGRNGLGFRDVVYDQRVRRTGRKAACTSPFGEVIAGSGQCGHRGGTAASAHRLAGRAIQVAVWGRHKRYRVTLIDNGPAMRLSRSPRRRLW